MRYALGRSDDSSSVLLVAVTYEGTVLGHYPRGISETLKPFRVRIDVDIFVERSGAE